MTYKPMRSPELRQDPITKDWVVMAIRRAQRPHTHNAVHRRVATLAHHDSACPFCSGNEVMTPPELYRANDAAGEWLVRVTNNKFPALSPDIEGRRTEGFFRSMPGCGHHEVIIESPDHAADLVDMSEAHILEIFKAYRERHREVSRDPKVRFVIQFRNHGERAGTSLVHPHSQMVATPVVPGSMRRKHQAAEKYFDDTGRNVFADLREAEIAEATRVVERAPFFTVIAPYASRAPYEMWILPNASSPSFVLSSDDELAGLAAVLRRTLRRLYACAGAVDYNYVVHSCPLKDEDQPFYCWHLQIVPRISETAGFEIGSGMFINTVAPEHAAGLLRSAPIED